MVLSSLSLSFLPLSLSLSLSLSLYCTLVTAANGLPSGGSSPEHGVHKERKRCFPSPSLVSRSFQGTKSLFSVPFKKSRRTTMALNAAATHLPVMDHNCCNILQRMCLFSDFFPGREKKVVWQSSILH